MKKLLAVLSALVLTALILLPTAAMAAGAGKPAGDGGPVGSISSSAAGTPIGDPGPLGGHARTRPVGGDEGSVRGLLADWLSWGINPFLRIFSLSGTSRGGGDAGPVGNATSSSGTGAGTGDTGPVGDAHSGTRDPIDDAGPGG